MSRSFFDTNILVYAFSTDPRQQRAQALIRQGGLVGVQSLNEFVAVSRRKLGFGWADVDAALASVRAFCPAPVALDLAIHEAGLRIAQTHRLRIYDSLLLAAALSGGCDIFWSEDMQGGLLIEDRLRIVNPFA